MSSLSDDEELSSPAESPLESPADVTAAKDLNTIVPPTSPTYRIPTLRSVSESQPPPMTSSSSPLGNVNAARRPIPTLRPGGMSADMAVKMKAFHESRRGAPPPPSNGATPASTAPSGALGSFSGPLTGGLASPSLPNTISSGSLTRPSGMTLNSSPIVPGVKTAPLKLGGLAAKRGLKTGMKLSDVTGIPATNGEAGQPNADAAEKRPDNAFNKFAEYVDTTTGTLNFRGKATIHGSGIDFSSGSSFSISLDEIDTMDELGKGNYGTVFKVRHSRPKVRRRGLGLAGNKAPPSMITSTASAAENPLPDKSGRNTTGLIMAMKEIRLELDDAKFAQIIMELDILHRCVSPFIVDFYGAFFQESRVFICMEYMDGGSIDKIYGDGIPEGVLRKIALSTVMGLKSLKDDHNIIHRDVKPTNILVNSRGQVKICDFGVSGNLVASIAKTNIGCQSYMAPERIASGGVAAAGAQPGGSYSVQSDIWSLGLTIIECAMGRYPYPPETYDNIFSQLSAIVDGEPPDLPGDGFSAEAHSFVQACLHKIPKQRPTYAMLLRHPWLEALMKPPTISEDAEAEAEAEAAASCGDNIDTTAQGLQNLNLGAASAASAAAFPDTSDKEVGSWVKLALERKRLGKSKGAAKPALHTVPLDAVPASPEAKLE